MDALLGNKDATKALTSGDNPLMYTYDGPNGTELRLSSAHTLTSHERSILSGVYEQARQTAVAQEHQRLMSKIAAAMLKKDGLDPDDYDLTA